MMRDPSSRFPRMGALLLGAIASFPPAAHASVWQMNDGLESNPAGTYRERLTAAGWRRS
jgi:hypothetical protein